MRLFYLAQSSIRIASYSRHKKQAWIYDGRGKVNGGLTCRKHSRWWYGQDKVDGKRYIKNLQVESRGTPPNTNEEHGSVQYEKSRSEAGSALKILLLEINWGKSAEDLAQTVYRGAHGR